MKSADVATSVAFGIGTATRTTINYEQEQIIKETRVAMEQERVRSLKQVQDEIAAIAILATSKIIGQHVDETANHQMFHELLKEVGEGQ